MHLSRKLALPALFAFLLLPALPMSAADDLQRVLHQLDVAAAGFHTTSADFEFDSVQTDPFPDTDVQKGQVFYEREGKSFKMAAHIREVNGKPVPKVYTYADGVFKLDEPMIDQVTTFKKAGKFESYVMLGFGASGKDLADKWDIKYLGQEPIDGVKTDKLELVAKDPTVRRNLPKVTIWLDPERGISLKQVFDEGQGQSRTCHYFNIKVNQSLPGDAFKFKTDSKTQFIDR
ncbi:MAG: outer membrane lipoprotein-sorting protein [Terracidiphilus sp.]